MPVWLPAIPEFSAATHRKDGSGDEATLMRKQERRHVGHHVTARAVV
jgi:hypothetical protein